MGKKNVSLSHLLSVLSVLLVLLGWQLYANSVGNPTLMPNPIDVFKELFKLLGTGSTYIIVLTTFKRLIISVMIAAFLGTILGLLSGMHYQLEALLKPIVVSLRTLPVISIIVVVLIMLGNTVSMYAISFLLLFPLIYQAELDGVKNIKPILLDVLKLDCDKCSWGAIRMVFFPCALPHLRTGILQSAGLGIKVLVVAEFIAQTGISIGRELYFSKQNLEFAKVFAWTIILIIIVLTVEYFVNKYMKYSDK